jgi:hypothetical protein
MTLRQQRREEDSFVEAISTTVLAAVIVLFGIIFAPTAAYLVWIIRL